MTAPFLASVVCPVLIDRVNDLAALRTLIDQAKRREGQVALLSGEAGVGKSRLVAEARTYATAQGFLLLQGQCFPTDRSCPYAPLLDLLRSHLTSASRAQVLADLGSVAAALSPLLPDLLPQPSELAPLPALGPEYEKRRLFAALSQLFLRLATEQPVLLTIEDLHWSDETSLEFLHYLARRCPASPMLVLLTYRSDEIQPDLRHFLAQLDRERLAQECTLAPLTRSDVSAMLYAIFALRRSVFMVPALAQGELLDAVYSLTEGNPFFIEELLKSLMEAGDIFYEDGRWERKELRALHIPRSVQDAIELRTARLSEGARRVLQVAAVAGRHFDFALLQALTHHDEAQLMPLIKELIAAQLVVEESADQFAFRHALTQQAVSAQLLVRDRRALHATIGETIERIHADRLADHASELSYHFSAAEAWSRALIYATRAGEQARALHAPDAAVEHFTRALTAARQCQPGSLASLLRERGLAYETLGDFEHALADLREALADARAHGDGDRHTEWQVLLDLGMTWASRDYAETGAYFQQALALARELGDPDASAHSLNRMGNWHLNADQPHMATTFHAEALSTFEQQGNRHAQAVTHDLLGMAYFQSVTNQRAADHLLQAAAIFRDLDDCSGLSSALATAVMTGGWGWCQADAPARLADDTLRQLADEALAAAREAHSPPATAFARMAVGGTVGLRGHLGQAHALLLEGLELAEASAHRQWQIAMHCSLARLYLDLLNPEKATPHARTACALAAELSSTIWDRLTAAMLIAVAATGHASEESTFVVEKMQTAQLTPTTHAQRSLLACLAAHALARGDVAQALSIVDSLLASAVGCESEADTPSLALLRAEALARLGRIPEAEATVRAVLAGPTVRVFRPQLWRAHVALGNLLARQGDAAGAAHHHRQGDGELVALADQFPDAELRDIFLRRARATMIGAAGKKPSRSPAQDREGLTRREYEVAQLIAQGMSNREIAATLTLSERTIEDHVSNILARLGFSSRARIAAWVAAQTASQTTATPGRE